MSQVKDFRDLRVWQASMNLVTEIYKATQGFPAGERYGLTGQLEIASRLAYLSKSQAKTLQNSCQIRLRQLLPLRNALQANSS